MDLFDNLGLLVPAKPATPTQETYWATVTSTTPLRVRLDTKTADLALPPVDLVGNLTTGDRVRVALDNGQAWITARRGGAQPVDTDWQPITPAAGASVYNGTNVRARGGIAVCHGSFVAAFTAGVQRQLGTLPAGIRPATTLYLPAITYDGQFGPMVLTPAGLIQITLGVTGDRIVSLDNITFSL